MIKLILSLSVLITFYTASSNAAKKCIDSVDSNSTSYPRLINKEPNSISYEGMSSSMGPAGEIRNLYFEKLISEFDLFNIKGSMKIKIPKKGVALVTVEEEHGVKVINFQIGKNSDEVSVAEKSLIEIVNEKQNKSEKMSKGSQLYMQSQRYQGMNVGQALEALATHVSQNPKRMTELKQEVQLAYEQLELDYMSIKKLSLVIPALVRALSDKNSKLPEPKENTKKAILKEIGSADIVRSWIVGDYHHIVTLYSKSQKPYLRIWSSTGEGMGLNTTIDLSTFDVNNPKFNFKSSTGETSLSLNTQSGSFSWSKGRNPIGEELRIVFALELFKIRLEEVLN